MEVLFAAIITILIICVCDGGDGGNPPYYC